MNKSVPLNGIERYFKLPLTVPLSPTEIPLNGPMVLNDTDWFSMVFSGIPLALFVRAKSKPFPSLIQITLVSATIILILIVSRHTDRNTPSTQPFPGLDNAQQAGPSPGGSGLRHIK